jgi:hypothetical protein
LQYEVDVYGLLPPAGSVSHSAGTPAGTVPTPARGALAAGVPDRNSPEISGGGPLPAVGPVVDIAAATPAGPATTGIAPAAAAPIVAPNSGPRSGGGARPLVTQSGNELATLHDLVISQSDGGNGLVPLPGLKKKGSGHLSWN